MRKVIRKEVGAGGRFDFFLDSALDRQIVRVMQGLWSIFLSEGAGDEEQAPFGRGSWDQRRSLLKFFIGMLLDCKKTPLLEYQSTSCLRCDRLSII